ncbi:hypothetical protein NEIFLAOT_01673 [Neisseria flavescens NRL30031/H210]|uniref:Uncharacterized protein n=1 Tax=Neisseria flavescens NRL30031/H210 TaxID=546264 RepID=C0ENY3_NEIFL|nr:hypothetical protein NEIFLAOT_01673 [Neisseria flavescens NRL30031/H210]
MEEPMRVMATKQDNLFILFSFYVFFLIGGRGIRIILFDKL